MDDRDGSARRSRTILAAFKRPEVLFLLIGPAFGVLVALLHAPLNAADENSHFYRAYLMSEGTLLPAKQDDTMTGVRGHIPKSLLDTANTLYNSEVNRQPRGRAGVERLINERRTLLTMPLDPSERVWVPMGNAPNFGPVCYIPQALGIGIGRLFGASPLLLIYLGRLANLAVYLAIAFVALRTTPVFKHVLMLVALLPMTLIQAGSLSADAATTALAFLLYALCLDGAFSARDALSNVFIASLYAATGLLILCKPGYFCLALLVFLIPASRVGSPRRCVALLGGYIVLQAACIALMVFLVDKVFVQPAGMNRDQQLEFILSNPLEYAKVLWVTFVRTLRAQPSLLDKIVGHVGNRPYIRTPDFLTALYCVAAPLLALADGRREATLALLRRALVAVVFALGVLQVYTMIYLYWTQVAFPMVTGLHGRVLIPLVPVLLLLLYNHRLIPARAWLLTLAAVVVSLVAGAATVHVMMDSFYLPKDNLIVNGDFRCWPESAAVPAGWQAPPQGGESVIEPHGHPCDPDFGVAQTWPSMPAQNVSFPRFATIVQLEPRTEYTLYVRATNPSRNEAAISAWEVIHAPGSTAMTFTPLSVEPLIVFPPRHDELSRFGILHTRTNGEILLTSHSLGTVFPATVIWHEWAVTR
ncbi:MAG TPA: DUF2142 domain-containing protein [Candidatus Hydrogenedentes bacterium]|nr:DUF2142 domain-containing protein [Candidatus Hydrogenedentota bacterium]